MSNISIGIVGLPNVGKSTLFNALLKKQQALAANYPFATIEPNVGIVPVPDDRLEVLAKITAGEILKQAQDKSQWPPIKQATVEFVDIAGLVKGASEGAGLGNKFLSHIREVQIIAHVVRAFTDDASAGSGQIIIREGSVDPKTDYEVINTELMLADLASLNKSLENRKIEPKKKAALEKAKEGLNNGVPVYRQQLTDEEKEELRDLFLLSAKPQIVVLNVSEQDYTPEKIEEVTEEYKEILGSVASSAAGNFSDTKVSHTVGDDNSADNANNIIVISAQIESDLAALSETEQKEYLAELGLEKSGLERLIQKAYRALGFISFLTAGEKEVRAWTIKKGSTAVQAAGEIHTDFMKKFIKAEVVGYSDFVENSGWKGSREKGKARLEGKEYIVTDGDVIEFKIGG